MSVGARNTIRTLASWVLPFILVCPLAAQTADEVLAANRLARGSDETWAGVETLLLRTTLNENGREYALVLQRKGPTLIRMQKEFPGRSELFIFDGRRGWLERAEEAREATPDEIASRLLQADLYLPWREPWAGFDRVEAVGSSELDGEPVHELALYRAAEVAERWFVSPASGQLVKTTATLVDEDGPLEIATYRFDFTEVEGLTFPGYVEIDLGTGLISQIPETIEINTPMSDTLFVVPGS